MSGGILDLVTGLVDDLLCLVCLAFRIPLSEVTAIMEAACPLLGPGRRGGVVDQPDLTGAVVYPETSEPPVTGGR
ncbi:MAG TPA: hypothetical protein VFW65_00795 [Pseudonocardiaceae bacterium]|nr:hypothetical protein [Pseudonocardiaceae bacterium]